MDYLKIKKHNILKEVDMLNLIYCMIEELNLDYKQVVMLKAILMSLPPIAKWK